MPALNPYFSFQGEFGEAGKKGKAGLKGYKVKREVYRFLIKLKKFELRYRVVLGSVLLAILRPD